LYLSRCVSVYDWTYAGLCRDRCRHPRLHLIGNLCLDRYNKPHAALNRALFEKSLQRSFKKLFESPFGSLFDLRYGWL